MANYPPIHQTFAEQLDFFRRKLNMPTEVWDDIERAAHDRAFIVAGAQGADLLYDLRAAIDKAIEKGTGLNEFRKDFKALVEKNGWTGWTGEGTPGGEAWRTKVIYQTNMATSYAAGRYKQLTNPALLKILPYWEYHHNDSVTYPRPLHVSWDGLTLPPDHPFWQTHFPPNGWGCQCWVTAVSKAKYMLAITNGKSQLPAGWDAIDPKTGAQVGIDKGFDYIPGAGVDTPLRQIVQDKLITYPDAISKALSYELNHEINTAQTAVQFARDVLADTSRRDALWLGFVENFEKINAATSLDVKGYLTLIPDEAPRHIKREHGNDGGSQRAPIAEDYLRVWEVLASYDGLSLSDKQSRHKLPMIEFWKRFGNEVFWCVFEVRQGRKNRSLALYTMYIKVKGGG